MCNCFGIFLVFFIITQNDMCFKHKKRCKHRLASFCFILFLFWVCACRKAFARAELKTRGRAIRSFSSPSILSLPIWYYNICDECQKCALCRNFYPFACNSSACSFFIAERNTTLSFSCVSDASTCSRGTHSTCAISPSRALMFFCAVCVRK